MANWAQHMISAQKLCLLNPMASKRWRDCPTLWGQTPSPVPGSLGSCHAPGWLTWLIPTFQVPGEVFLPVPAGVLAACPAGALLPKSSQGESQAGAPVYPGGARGGLPTGFRESELWERVGEEGREVNVAFCPCQEEIPRQLRCIALYLVHIAGAYLLK